MPVTQVKYRLTTAQMAYRRSNALHRGLVGGIGSGKSWIGAYDLIRRAKPGRLYMAVGPTYVMLQDSSLRSFLRHAKELNYLKQFRRGDMVAELGNGSEIVFRTAEDPERLRGPNLSGVWLDEASLMGQEVFNIVIGRLREEGEQGFLGATFTPKGRFHWTYKVFASGGPDSEVFRARTTDNPFLPDNFADVIRRQYTERMARQELGGEFLDDETEYLYPDAWLVAAQRRADELRGVKRVAKVIGIDPAEGGDKTTMSAVDELGLIEQVGKQTPDTSVITSEAIAFGRKHNVPSENWIFDRGGGGQQHADRLRTQGYRGVRTVPFGETLTLDPRRGMNRLDDRKAIREERYAFVNRRAEMSWMLRELLDPSLNTHVFGIPAEYTELRRQLAPIPLLYDQEGRVRLLPKNKRSADSKEKTLTELIGHSPDEFDSLILAVFGMKNKERKAKVGVR